MASRDIKFLVNDLKKATVEGARTACVKIMNDLVEAGPAYSGDFSASWYAVAPGKTAGGPRSSTGLYNYTLRNVPKTKFKETGLYKIVNTSEYADQAMDIEKYKAPTKEEWEEIDEREDLGKNINKGARQKGATRGQVRGKGGATSSAPADWWSTFGVGGGLDKSLKKGFIKGFLTFGKAPKKGFG